MYLKRLDLQGFKSFPEKVKLDFNQGVTAVVGPNGSGKSNVSDAVRWVLGEQRAKSLRGDKMEDVIFAGTETRKPLGFAEVSITIDNEDQRLPLDFTEVQITRRVFRSGESEYRINGAACRLRDVQELFMDTGIGREGYSIIGQGRIDEILSAKGDERRRIFEEAAGIVKYKTRRNEATSKLEKEQQNLVRVDDIISELEVQLLPLEKQSEKAKQYLSLKEELKKAEVVTYCKELDRMEVALQELEEEKNVAKEQVAEYLKQAEEEKIKTHNFKRKAEELERLQQENNDKVAEVMAEKERREGEIRLAEQQRQNDAENILRIEAEIAEKEAQIQANGNEMELSGSRIVALKMEMEQAQTKLNTLDAEYNSLTSALNRDETQAESFKDEVFEQIRVGTEAKGEIAKREAVMEQFKGRMAQLQGEKEQAESRIHQLAIHAQVIEKKENDLKENILFLQKELQTLESDREHALLQKEKAQNRLFSQEKVLSETRSRLSLLIEMEKENEGFFHSVKSLLNLPDREQRGICGAVGQLFKVDEKYEVAIEAALGGAVQNIVTRKEEDARDAIRFLKARNLGRATFLPISAIRGRTFDGHPLVLDESGVVGVAHELIEYDEMYSQIAKSLLGRTLIVETIDRAVELAKKYKHQYKMVTLEGDILNPGGAMTGGSSQKKATHIFGRGREIRQLQEKAKHAEEVALQLQNSLALSNEDMEEIEEQFVEKKLELQKITVTLHSGDGDKEKTQQEKQEAQDRLRRVLLEEKQLQEQIERTLADIQKSKALLEHSEKTMQSANERLTQYQENLSGEKEKRDSIMHEMTQLKINISNSGQNVYNVEETLMRLKRENELLLSQKKQAEDRISQFSKSGDIRLEQQEELKQLALELEKEIAELQSALGLLAKERSDALRESELAEENVLNRRESATKMENEIFRIETKKEKNEEEKIRITTLLWEEYELTHRMAKEYAQNLLELNEKFSVKELRTQIRDLGDVNVGAIEQYKEVRERYTFLTQQRADILEAEEKLRGIIQELSELMEKQFREQFDLISENFSRVFKEMFGGGKAYLKLADETKILESPIEIVAQPPGKNLQNMQLLSGGERALTAIAILFSILYMKPSPFCILDEIEAALDDANVTRYAQYLKRFSEKTQFIVITHRKGTMEHADVLYGVTMQEKGISKLISVDFSEKENLAL